MAIAALLSTRVLHVLTLTSFLVLFLSSCSTLPHYGRPSIQEGFSLKDLSTITYRTLTPKDFKAKELSGDKALYADKLNAYTSVSMRPVKGAQYVISPVTMYSEKFYVGSIKNLAFEAIMIPERSWWSPRVSAGKRAYVLQHEQIHFALMEIVARQLNKYINDTPGALIVSAETPDKVRMKLRELVDQLVVDSRKDIIDEHTRFDEDTSGYFVPKIQQQWYDRVNEQLRQLSL